MNYQDSDAYSNILKDIQVFMGHKDHLFIRLGVFGTIGHVMGFLLLVSPVITFKKIIARRSTENFSVMPYIVALFDYMIAIWYDKAFIPTEKDYSNNIISPIGVAIELIYVIVFLIFASRRGKLITFGLFALVFGAYSFITRSFVVAFDKEDRRFYGGIIAMISNIATYISPLSIRKMVKETNSVEYMPFHLSLFGFLNATSWFICGAIEREKYVYIPNAFGMVFGGVQLNLYRQVYYNKKNNARTATVDSCRELEVVNRDEHQDEQGNPN